MKKLTKQQWDEIEAKYSLYNPVKLIVDGHQLSLHKEFGKSDKLINFLFIDGFFKGVYTNADNPFQKYMYPKQQTYRSHSDKELRKLKRELGAKLAKRFEPRKYTVYTPFFPSFKAFKRHVIKLSVDIEIDNK